MRYTKKDLKIMCQRVNGYLKEQGKELRINVERRYNSYYTVMSIDGSKDFQSGLSAREAYMFLRGMDEMLNINEFYK